MNFLLALVPAGAFRALVSMAFPASMGEQAICAALPIAALSAQIDLACIVITRCKSACTGAIGQDLTAIARGIDRLHDRLDGVVPELDDLHGYAEAARLRERLGRRAGNLTEPGCSSRPCSASLA